MVRRSETDNISFQWYRACIRFDDKIWTFYH